MTMRRPDLSRTTLRTTAAGLALVVLLLALGVGARAVLTDQPTGTGPTAEPTPEEGMGAGDDNVAVANNTRDGSEVCAVRLKIVQTLAAVVDSGNAAVAAASCENCTTVAIAIEGVLVVGNGVEEVTPVNLALALNTDCTGCQTLAAAYQYLTRNDTGSASPARADDRWRPCSGDPLCPPPGRWEGRGIRRRVALV